MNRIKRALSLAAVVLALAVPAFAQEGAEAPEPEANPFGATPAPQPEEEEEAPAARPAPRQQPAQADEAEEAEPAQRPTKQPRQARPQPAQQQRAQQQPAQQQPAQRPAPQQAEPVAEQSPRPVLRQSPQPEAEATEAEQLAPPSDEAMDEALDEALEQGIADDDLFDPTAAGEVGAEIAEEHGDYERDPLEAADDEPVEALEVGEGPPGAVEHEGEHAEEEAHEPAHFDATVFGMQALNFLVWLAIIVFLARKPMSEFLKNRRLAVEEGLEEAKRVKEEATAKYEEYSERLERLDEELAKLRKEMIDAGEAERDRIIAEAEARAARMRKDAQFVIDQQMKQLRADLTKESIEAAVAAAEKVLVEQTSAADQQKLADAYLARLEEEARA